MSRKSKFYYNLTRIRSTCHEDQYTFMIISCSILRMRNVSYKSYRENHKTYFVSTIFFFDNLAVVKIMWKNTVEPERPQVTI
jgi:hypothetical protein